MPLASTPSSFHIGAYYDGFAQYCTFTIPAGTYTGGVWEVTGNYQGTVGGNDEVNVGGHIASFSSHITTGNYSKTTNVTANQLALINAAAGGTLGVTYTTTTFAYDNHVQTFYLTLTQPAGPPVLVTLRTAFLVTTVVSPPTPNIPIMIDIPPAVASTGKGENTGWGSISSGNSVTIPLISAKLSSDSIYIAGGPQDKEEKGGEMSDREGGVIGTSGYSLVFTECLSGAGDDWKEEVVVAENVDRGVGGICCINNTLYVAAYSRQKTIYVKRTYDPNDWGTGAQEIDTGYKGIPYGIAANNMGVLCIITDYKCLVSRDMGTTWTEGGTVTFQPVQSIVSLKHMFIVFTTNLLSIRRAISEDDGMTWSFG